MESRRKDKKDLIKLLKKGTDKELALFFSTMDAKKVLSLPLTFSGETALHICAKHTPWRIPYLLGLGADAKIINYSGQDALQTLLHRKDLIKGLDKCKYDEIAMQLARAGANVNARGKGGKTFLHFVARAEGGKKKDRTYFYGLEELLTLGADPSIKDFRGRNALHHYAQTRIRPLKHRRHYFRKGILLIQHGADPDTVTHEGKTLLHESAILRPSYIPKLLKLKADPTIKVKLKIKELGTAWEYTPLSLLIRNNKNKEGFVHYVKALLDHGANPNDQDFNRQTLLGLAAESRPDLIPGLIARGAIPNKKNEWRLSPLQILMRQAVFNMDAAISLVLAGADPHTTNDKNETLLHCAVILQNSKHIPLLLQLGVEDTLDWSGNSAFSLLMRLMRESSFSRTGIDCALALLQRTPKDQIDSDAANKLQTIIYETCPKIKNYLATLNVPAEEFENFIYLKEYINLASFRLEIKHLLRTMTEQERSKILNTLLVLAMAFVNDKAEANFKLLPYEVMQSIIDFFPIDSALITRKEINSLSQFLFENAGPVKENLQEPGGFNVRGKRNKKGKYEFSIFKSAEIFARQVNEDSEKHEGSKRNLRKDAIKCWKSQTLLFGDKIKPVLYERIEGTPAYQDKKILKKLK